MTKIEIEEAERIDYLTYAAFQKEAYRDLLKRTGATDKNMTPDFYRWKYHTPAGKGRIAKVLEDGKIVSCSAMIPLWIRSGDETVRGWHCLDVATLPDARRKGYFRAALSDLKNTIPQGEMLFAFPNEHSIPSFIKLGCRENVVLTTWINPLALLNMPSSFNVRQVQEFAPGASSFIKTANAGRPFLDRSPNYLNWRYARHPHNKYALFVCEKKGLCAGFGVTRTAHVMGCDLALVMELWGSDASVEISLLRHAVRWASEQKKWMLAMMNTDISLWRSALAFFFPLPSFLLPKRQVLVLGDTDAKTNNLTNKRWILQTGDWDVF